MTDSIKAIAENTSKAPVAGVGVVDFGAILKKRWFDLLEPEDKEEAVADDQRSCREIADDIWKRIRGGK